MSATSSQALIVSAAIDFGWVLLDIMWAIIVIMVGILIFREGWHIIKGLDRSGRIGGFYYWRTPYKGYKRFRSQRWNLEHTA